MTFEQIMQSEGFVPNAEQRPVIESTKNTVVSAGAGAGKTAVLSWRFLRLVMEEGVKPEQILTLTFTKKAATEMKERIYTRLLKAKDSLPSGSLDSFRYATISTLDSFCAQIVRSDCTSYGIARDFANISDDDLSEMTSRLAKRFIADDENAEERAVLSKLFMPNSVMQSFFDLIAEKSSITEDYDAEKITTSLMESLRLLYQNRRNFLFQKFDELENLPIKGKFAETYQRLRLCLENESFAEGDYFRLTGVKDQDIKDLVANELNPIIGKNSNFVLLQNVVKSDVKVSILQRAVQKFVSMLNSEKRRLGALTFNDVQSLAVDILCKNLDLRQVFKEKFRFIMIDEFQDNNSVQRDLLFLLSERNSIRGQAGQIPTIQDLESEKLFFVGDEKQSIYSFRGADVSVFRNLQNDISQNGLDLSLNTNYRSQKKLIRHFNDVFNKVLIDTGKAYYARYEEIQPGRPADNTNSHIILAVYNRGNIPDPDMNSNLLEAEAIGNYCYRALNTDDFLVDGKRPKPEDIAILFRAASNQMNIEKALKRRGIEYQIVETRSLMLEAVASDFYCLLNYILYPEDTRSLIAVLKSPFCGLCEQSLQNLFVGNLPVLPLDADRYQLFLTFLEKVKQNAFRLSISQLLELILVEGGYKAYLSSNDDRETFQEHFEYLFSYAISYDSENKSLTDYVRFLRNHLGQSEKLPETSVLHGNKTGVQIMTIHKSKGLEFKIVLYVGIGTGVRGDAAPYVFSYQGNLISTEQKALYNILDDDRKDREEAELRRLMYVAMTRAKDHLILIGGYKVLSSGEVKSERVLNWYAQAIGADLENCTSENPDVEICDISQTPRDFGSRSVIRTFTFPPAFSDFAVKRHRLSVTALERLTSSPISSEEVVLGIDEIFSDVVSNKATLTKLYDVDNLISEKSLQDEFGTLCHQVLEETLRNGSADDIQCTICESESENQKLLSQAKAFANTFLESPLYKTLILGNPTLEELRFYTNMEELPDVAIEGVIDLLVMGKTYNLVIDYKTDVLRDPEKHKLQVLSYVKVAEDLYHKPCFGLLFYLRDGSIGPIWDHFGKSVQLSTSL